MATIFDAKDITVSFGKHHAVQHANLTANSGEIIAFLGPNGAGKTTFLKASLGLVHRTAGTTIINGAVGALFDDGGLIPGLTGRQYLHATALFHNKNPHSVKELLDMVHMSTHANRKIKHYSLGMKRRIALAAALIPQPHLLFLDEPANGLDPEGIMWLGTFLKNYADQGNAVVISTHLLKEAATMSTHTIIIRNGHTIFSGPTTPELEQHYFATIGENQP